MEHEFLVFFIMVHFHIIKFRQCFVVISKDFLLLWMLKACYCLLFILILSSISFLVFNLMLYRNTLLTRTE